MAIDVEQQRLDLEHYEWFVRAEAIRKLETAKAEEAVEDIATRLTTDESLYVRAAAARALGKIRSSKAVDALIQALNDESFHVRQAAMWSLGEIGAPAEKALPQLRALTESRERFPQAELTTAEVAKLVVDRIEYEVQQAEEARQKAEAARAAKAQAEQAAAQAAAQPAAQPEAAAPAAADTAAVEEEVTVAEADALPAVTPEQIREMRQAALARHKEIVAKMREAGIDF